MRIAAVLCLSLLLPSLIAAKDKKKSTLPDYVLQAKTVAVIVDPEAPVSAVSPNDNKQAADSVEKAFMTWGRYQLVMDARTADLVILVRKGRAPGPVLAGPGGGAVGGGRDPGVIVQQPSDSQTRVTGQWGTPPPLSQQQQQQQRQQRTTGVGSEGGSYEDLFEVYRGQTEFPLDNAPTWRYSGKDALKAPDVEAVEQFKKAVTAAEKAKN